MKLLRIVTVSVGLSVGAGAAGFAGQAEDGWAADDLPLSPGVAVTKDNLLGAIKKFGRTIGIESKRLRWNVVLPGYAERDLAPLVGKKVSLLTVYDIEEDVPAEIETVYARVTFKSAHIPAESQDHQLHPPLVGAWYEYHHNPPMVFRIQRFPAYKRGGRRTYSSTADGRTYAAYLHGDSKEITGRLISVTNEKLVLDIGDGRSLGIRVSREPFAKLLVAQRQPGFPR